jgi:hypothetical protein
MSCINQYKQCSSRTKKKLHYSVDDNAIRFYLDESHMEVTLPVSRSRVRRTIIQLCYFFNVGRPDQRDYTLKIYLVRGINKSCEEYI